MGDESRTIEEAGSEKPPTAKAEPKQDEASEIRRQNEDLLARLTYLQADFENYRKRSEREMESVVKFAHEVLVARLLPVLDEMDAAVAALEGAKAEGVRLVRDNLAKALKEAGLQEIPAAGQPFDPYVHECVQQVAQPGSKDGTITEVVRKGYRLHDRVLRPAHVIVVKNGGETDA